MKKLLAWILAVSLVLPWACAAGDSWLTFGESDAPEDSGFLVNEYTGQVTITFLGDCTLGGEESMKNSRHGFVRTVEKNGMAWPFHNLLSVTEADDLTVANLEGVLSDRDLEKEEKTFNFMGPTAYTEILTLGSIECVTLANNHSHDYGNGGYSDTKKALESAGIAYFGTDCMAIWEHEGLRIGFLGVFYSLNGSYGKRYERQMAILQDMGCSAVITVMHAGEEHTGEVSGVQKAIAQKAASSGSCLVVGHHPHVVQGFSVVDGVPVAYSLGNCSFGGNAYPDDSDALIVQAVLSFDEGEYTGCELHFLPISTSSVSGYSDFAPTLLTGDDAQRVLDKMEASTGYTMPAYEEGQGSVLRFEQ